jgi:hypothetical protein
MAKRKSIKGQTTINNTYIHTYKTKYRVTRTSLRTGDEFGWSGRVGSSCLTRDTRRVNLVTNPVISHERGKDREVFTVSFYWSTCIKPGKWVSMYMCVKRYQFCIFSTIFRLDFRIIFTAWYFLFFILISSRSELFMTEAW